MDAREDVRPTGRGGRGVTAKSHVIVTSNMSVRQCEVYNDESEFISVP